MAKQYSIAEARANLPTIVDQAEAGQEIELTRRGKAVAVVVSLREFDRLRGARANFGDVFRDFLATHGLNESPLEEGFPSIARDKSPGRKVDL